MIKRLRPYLGVGLAAWLGYSTVTVAQDDFYIELRGPESTESARPNALDNVPNTNQPAAQGSTIVRQTAPTPPTINTGRYGPIRSTDTLWAIAARHTKAPVTVQQTMVALYHLNSQAFVRGNINHLQRGAQLRLPTETQATQRSAGEAETEFRRLSRQGSRRVARAATASTSEKPQQVAQTTRVAAQPVKEAAAVPVAVPKQPTVVTTTAPIVAPSAPMAAPPPSTSTNGLTEPKAAPTVIETPVSPARSPAQAEDTALNRLQLQLMDELREQVSMSNEQLTALADNNQALRQRLTQLTAEVEDLKSSRNTTERELSDTQQQQEKAPAEGWLSDLLNNPLNLALILILPALLLLALFTLWWRNRERRDLAEQEQELSETSVMLEDERDDFDDLFSADDELDLMPDETLDDLELEAVPDVEPEPEAEPELEAEPEPEPEVDEDAFARFLEEQQLQEEAENQRQQEATKEAEAFPEPDLSDVLFEDAEEEITESEQDIDEDILFDDEAMLADNDGERMSNDDLDDLFGNTETELEESKPADVSESAPVEAEEKATVDATPPEVDTAETLADSLFADGAPAASFDDSLAMDAQADSLANNRSAERPDNSALPEDYVSVDQLMAEAEASDGSISERERKLDLELDNYADVIGQGDGVDIDADEGGIGAQLDLARAYIEIDDIDSARDLLNEALERGNEAQQRDAQKLLQRLDKRG